MSDPFSMPAIQRPLSRREVLWNELEQLHEHLLMEPPTATLTLEDLEAEVERLRLLLGDVQHASNE
jgi:tRNA U34 5-methylaminomethyl-2-thiouridine-forming methyltransferase MnmC